MKNEVWLDLKNRTDLLLLLTRLEPQQQGRHRRLREQPRGPR